MLWVVMFLNYQLVIIIQNSRIDLFRNSRNRLLMLMVMGCITRLFLIIILLSMFPPWLAISIYYLRSRARVMTISIPSGPAPSIIWRTKWVGISWGWRITSKF